MGRRRGWIAQKKYDLRGIVYLIHFNEPYHHARHYLGFVQNDLEHRLYQHRSGYGSPLMRAVTDAGISWRVVRTWENATRDIERRLKNWKNLGKLCPICKDMNRKPGNRNFDLVVDEMHDFYPTNHRGFGGTLRTQYTGTGAPTSSVGTGASRMMKNHYTDEDREEFEDLYADDAPYDVERPTMKDGLIRAFVRDVLSELKKDPDSITIAGSGLDDEYCDACDRVMTQCVCPKESSAVGGGAGGAVAGYVLPMGMKPVNRKKKTKTPQKSIARAFGDAKPVNEAVTNYRWGPPDPYEEIKEFARVADEHDLQLVELMKASKRASIVVLHDDMWRGLRNTESYATETEHHATFVAEQRGKDIWGILEAMKEGRPLPVPIVMELPSGVITLVAGNTRLMAARALGIVPHVLYVSLSSNSEENQ